MFEVLDKLEAAGEGVVVLLTDGAEDLERGELTRGWDGVKLTCIMDNLVSLVFW